MALTALATTTTTWPPAHPHLVKLRPWRSITESRRRAGRAGPGPLSADSAPGSPMIVHPDATALRLPLAP
jgi:hypothetical protein